jgi:uncharacterized sulfatase
MSRFVAVLALAAVIAPAAAAPPNLVLIVADDYAWTDYSFMGHPNIRTPNLDRLAAQSLTFTRGYVPSSLCSPSLATILTGRYPHQHRITSNDPRLPAGTAKRGPVFRDLREQMFTRFDPVDTLPELLGRHGYLSLQTGKWWLSDYRRGGFTHGMTHGDTTRNGRHGDEGLRIGRETMQPIYDFVATARKESKPFFVWYAPMLPHTPHNPPERLLAKYQDKAPTIHIARYWAMVEWFDEACGDLLRHLDQQGLADSTMVAYVTDNGWIQMPDEGRYAPKSKQSPYDGGLRTPIMVRWPGKVKPAKSEALASSIDLVPTLLHAAGVQAPAGLPGVNLLDEAAVRQRDTLFGACFTHDAVDLDAPARSVRWRWCIEKNWKVIVPDAVNEPKDVVELYDLAADPREERNLAATQPDRVAHLRKRLDAWWDAK